MSLCASLEFKDGMNLHLALTHPTDAMLLLFVSSLYLSSVEYGIILHSTITHFSTTTPQIIPEMVGNFPIKGRRGLNLVGLQSPAKFRWLAAVNKILHLIKLKKNFDLSIDIFDKKRAQIKNRTQLKLWGDFAFSFYEIVQKVRSRLGHARGESYLEALEADKGLDSVLGQWETARLDWVRSLGRNRSSLIPDGEIDFEESESEDGETDEKNDGWFGGWVSSNFLIGEKKKKKEDDSSQTRQVQLPFESEDDLLKKLNLMGDYGLQSRAKYNPWEKDGYGNIDSDSENDFIKESSGSEVPTVEEESKDELESDFEDGFEVLRRETRNIFIDKENIWSGEILDENWNNNNAFTQIPSQQVYISLLHSRMSDQYLTEATSLLFARRPELNMSLTKHFKVFNSKQIHLENRDTSQSLAELRQAELFLEKLNELGIEFENIDLSMKEKIDNQFFVDLNSFPYDSQSQYEEALDKQLFKVSTSPIVQNEDSESSFQQQPSSSSSSSVLKNQSTHSSESSSTSKIKEHTSNVAPKAKLAKSKPKPKPKSTPTQKTKQTSTSSSSSSDSSSSSSHSSSRSSRPSSKPKKVAKVKPNPTSHEIVNHTSFEIPQKSMVNTEPDLTSLTGNVNAQRERSKSFRMISKGTDENIHENQKFKLHMITRNNRKALENRQSMGQALIQQLEKALGIDENNELMRMGNIT